MNFLAPFLFLRGVRKIQKMQIAADDTTVHWMNANNELYANKFVYDRYRSRFALIISVKCIGSIPTPPSGMRQHAPFWNVERNGVKRFIWWQDINNKTIYEVRYMVAKILDKLYSRIHTGGAGITGMRITLVDWKTSKPVPPKELAEHWWTTTSWGMTKLDGMRLRSWGIPFAPPDYKVDYEIEKPKLIEPITIHDAKYSVKDAIYSGITAVITHMPQWLAMRSVMQVSKDQVLQPTDIRRIVVTLRSSDFHTRAMEYLTTLFTTDQKFAKKAVASSGRRMIEQKVQEWCWEEITSRILRNKLLNKDIK